MKVSKFRYIFIGLAIGLIIGLGISTISDSHTKFDYLIKLKDLLTFNSKFDNEQEKPVGIINEKISSVNTEAPDKSIRKSDSLYLLLNDTSLSDDEVENLSTSISDNSDVVVYRDKMIFSKYFNVTGLSQVSKNKIGLLDSLLMNDVQKRSKDMLLVEFWQSPVNYRGYKLSENKLIIFGIDDHESTSIEIINKEIYIFYQNRYYLLEYTNDYKPLILSYKSESSGTK